MGAGVSAQASTTTASGGVSFSGLLTVLFVGLKLAGVIAWSWWWVLSPIWISFIIVAMLVILIAALSSPGRR